MSAACCNRSLGICPVWKPHPNDPFNNLNLPLPFPDALQEFKVETSALSAQYGMHSSASVNSVTKSGTNDLHGTLFEFVRNDLFNARNYFATKNSTLKRHQFGGVAGGPIAQNKLFFFGGYQGTTVRQDPSDVQGYIPTAAMLDGDFTAVAAPQCNAGRQIPLRAPFVNNRIDPAQFSRAALNLAKKLPQTANPCGLIIYGIRTVTDEHQFVGRLDYQWSNNHTLFGRYMASSFEQPAPYSFNQNLLNTPTPGFDNLAQSYALGSTYLLSPNTVNSYRLPVNRTAINRIPAEFFSAPDFGVNMYSYTPIQTKVVVTGGFTIGANFGPNRTTTYQTSDDLSLVRGTHQLALGANLAYWRNNLNAEVFSPGNWTFNGQVTGLGLADFLTGNASQLMQSTPNKTYMSQWYFGSYVADAWRMTPRLTLNYGLRWEPYFPQVKRDGVVANFDEERYKAGLKSTVFKNAPAGFTYPGDPGFPGSHCRKSGPCFATGLNKQWRNLSPRAGLAWDVHGDGRASYGLSYDMLAGGFFITFISPPWNNSIILAFPAGGFDNPWLGYPGGNPFPARPPDADAPFVPFGNYFVIKRDDPSTSKNSWNLSVQRQIARSWLASASYIGSQYLGK